MCYEWLYSALHYSTRAERGSDIGFSLCAVPNYLILMSEYFKCILGTLRISRGVRSVQGVQM